MDQEQDQFRNSSTESGTRYTPASDHWLSVTENVTYMHLPFDNVHPTLAFNVNYCLFCGLCEVWFTLYKILKKQQCNYTCCTWTESGPKNVPRLKSSDVEPEWSRTRTWTCSNTINWPSVLFMVAPQRLGISRSVL